MKRNYLSRLSRAARWYLPPAEAAEVLEDYREIVEGRSGEELRRDLGTPRAAMRQLAQPKAYRRWLAVFGILSVCVALPAITPLWQELSFNAFKLYRLYWFWDIGRNVIPFTWVFFAVGMTLSLVWLRHNGGKGPGRAVPKRIWPLLALLLMGMSLQWFIAWLILGERWELLNSLFSTAGSVSVMRLFMGVDAVAMGLIGLRGLLLSRLGDRRWSAVYVLGLAGVILSLSVWALLTSLYIGLSAVGWQTPVWIRYLFITFMGLLGTGVSLC